MHEIAEMELCYEWGDSQTRKGEFMSSSACTRRKVSHKLFDSFPKSIIRHSLHFWPLRSLSHMCSQRSWPPGWRLWSSSSTCQTAALSSSCLISAMKHQLDKLPLPSLGSSCSSLAHSWDGEQWTLIMLIVFPRLTYEADKMIRAYR